MARNKSFDEKLVLKKAMELFWKQGYEKTSMQELVDHMGIHRKSIYDTFGDKRALFQASLNHYETFVNNTFAHVVNDSPTVKQAIRNIFNFVIESSNYYPEGCMTVNAAVELSLLDEDVQKSVSRMFKDTELLFEQLLKSGQKNGEVRKDMNTHSTSKLLHNNLIGVRVLVKTDYTNEGLESIIDLVMKVLD